MIYKGYFEKENETCFYEKHKTSVILFILKILDGILLFTNRSKILQITKDRKIGRAQGSSPKLMAAI